VDSESQRIHILYLHTIAAHCGGILLAGVGGYQSSAVVVNMSAAPVEETLVGTFAATEMVFPE
jgi:hypothetical protein